MATQQSYALTSKWTGNRESVGHFAGQGLTNEFSVPTELGGPGVGTNPEELLLAAASGCYIITLASMLTNRKIPFTGIELSSEIIVENDKGLRVESITHRPVITIDNVNTTDPVDVKLIEGFALHAEHACMVSSALRGNVIFSVEPVIKVINEQK